MTDVQDKNQTTSDEDPDYMSEEFLQQCTSNDVRPSLLHSRAEKRKHDVLKRQLELNKTKTEKDKDMLRSVEDALKVPISKDNKGFKMLQRMGYQPGSSLGKDKNDPSQKRITAPIGIELKHGRGGLGREQHELEKQQHKLTLGDPEKYRARQQSVALAREIFLDLKKAKFACQSLDEEFGKAQPVETWYWPRIKNAKVEKDVDSESEEDEGSIVPMKKPRVDNNEEDNNSSSSEEDEDVPDEEKLIAVSNYLRSQYSYCLWCATRYDDNTDMQKSCPGETKDDH